jgi:hypothetical protein
MAFATVDLFAPPIAAVRADGKHCIEIPGCYATERLCGYALSLAGRKGLGLAWWVAQCAWVMGTLVAISWAEAWISYCGACTNN